MATNNGFDPNDPLPLFLSTDEPEPGIEGDKAVISLRFVTASILVAAATAIGVSILSVRIPVTLFADVTASIDLSAPQSGTDEPVPAIQWAAIQSTADADAPRTAKDAPTGEVGASEAVSASEPAGQAQAENSETSETLFREFQAWNFKQDARDSAKPLQGDPAPVGENARAPARPLHTHRRARTVRYARTDNIRHVQKRGANIRQRNEQAQARSVQDARAQTLPVQYAEPPSFLERLNPFGAGSPQR